MSETTIQIPRPEKFDGSNDVILWFKQFELFLSLSKVSNEQKGNVLLVYLGTSISGRNYRY
jgi:hypothetical protein